MYGLPTIVLRQLIQIQILKSLSHCRVRLAKIFIKIHLSENICELSSDSVADYDAI